MKTAEQTAQQVIENFDADNQTPEGERVGFGILADEDLVTWMIDAIEADQKQRADLILSFEPDAIREHFEVEEDDPTEGMTDEQLIEIGKAALQDDRLYEVFHEILKEGVAG